MGFAHFMQVGLLALLCLGFSSADRVFVHSKMVEKPNEVGLNDGSVKNGEAGGIRITGGGGGRAGGGWKWAPIVGRRPIYQAPKPGYGQPVPDHPPCGGGGGGGNCPYCPAPTPVISCPVGCVPASYGYGLLDHRAQKRPNPGNLGEKTAPLAQSNINGPSFGLASTDHGSEAQKDAGNNNPNTGTLSSESANWNDMTFHQDYRGPGPSPIAYPYPNFEFGSNAEDKKNHGLRPNGKRIYAPAPKGSKFRSNGADPNFEFGSNVEDKENRGLRPNTKRIYPPAPKSPGFGSNGNPKLTSEFVVPFNPDNVKGESELGGDQVQKKGNGFKELLNNGPQA